MSRKPKLNTKSSTQAELVGADDVLTNLLWTRYFMEAQGYKQNPVLFQDNTSAILLEKMGMRVLANSLVILRFNISILKIVMNKRN